MRPIKVLIADDHTLFRQGLQRLLTESDDLVVVGEAVNGEEAVALAGQLEPDVALMDVTMPGIGGVEAARRLRQAQPQVQVIMLTVSEKDEHLFASIKAGAHGYLLKNAQRAELIEAIRRVCAGEAIVAPAMAVRLIEEFSSLSQPAEPETDGLTDREIEVLHLVAQGLSNKQIAAELSLSEHTVKTHLRHILDKLHLRSRTQAAAYAARTGLIDHSPQK